MFITNGYFVEIEESRSYLNSSLVRTFEKAKITIQSISVRVVT